MKISVYLTRTLKELPIWICTIFLLWDSPAFSNMPSRAIPHLCLQRHHYSIAGFRAHVAIANVAHCLIICVLNASVCNYFKTNVFALLRLKWCHGSLNYDLNMFWLNQFLHLTTVGIYTGYWDAPVDKILETNSRGDRWWELGPPRPLLTKNMAGDFVTYERQQETLGCWTQLVEKNPHDKGIQFSMHTSQPSLSQQESMNLTGG